jgi:T-complex protein 1 subunit alpha
LKYFVEAGAIAVRRVRPEDLKRIAKASGGQIVSTLADMDGNEVFDNATLGEADEVSEERVGDGELLYFRGCKGGKAVTIVLRGANEFLLDEMDRSLHDSLCVIKRIIESNTLVAGGGAVETAVATYLEGVATSMSSKEQMAIAQYAEALLVIPRVLSVNAAKDATELVSQLRAHHYACQNTLTTPNMTKEEIELNQSRRFIGLDLVNGVVRNNLDAGVVEPAISKIKSLRFATEAAVSILRIDDFMKLNNRQQQEGQR